MEWIDVNERLPEIDQKCLIFAFCVVYGCYSLKEWQVFQCFYIEDGLFSNREERSFDWELNDVKYWMPFPKLPNDFSDDRKDHNLNEILINSGVLK